MSISHLTPTFSDIKTWVRSAAVSVNRLITGKQDVSDNLTSLSALDLTGNSGDVVTVKATEDGFELTAGGGGGGTTTNALTMNNGGAGAASGTTFDGSVARTISYNTVGAAASSHTHAQADVTNLVSDLAAKQPLDADLTAVAGVASNGLLARTGAGTAAARTITAGNSGTTVTNGSGESGNPTITSGVWALAGTGQTNTGVWSFADDGAKTNVDFVGLGAFNEIKIVVDAVTASGVVGRTIRFSTDNGSTFHSTSGDYAEPAAAGTVTNRNAATFTSAGATAAQTMTCNIQNTKGAVKEYTSSGAVARALFKASASDINAVRVTTTTADTMNGGKIYVYAR